MLKALEHHPLPARMLIAVSIATLLTQGCTMTTNTESMVFDRQQTAAEARQQLSAQLSTTTLADGQRQLRQQGFECEAAAPTSTQDGTLVLCTLAPDTPADAPPATTPPTPVTWFVSLLAADGIDISEVQVRRAPRFQSRTTAGT